MTAAHKLSDQNTDSSPDALDETSLSAIRSILVEQDDLAPQHVQDEPKQPAPHRAPAPTPLPRRKADGLPELESPVGSAGGGAYNAEEAPKAPKRRFAWLRRGRTTKPAPVTSAKPEMQFAALDALKARVRGYRPKPSHIALGVLAALVLFRPWLMLGLVFLTFAIMAGIFLMLGYDGFWQSVMKIGRWYAKRRPARAAVVHARLDRLAMRWDTILDRFPEGTVDGLYMPDFGELATAEARHDAAMERRLAGLSGKGA